MVSVPKLPGAAGGAARKAGGNLPAGVPKTPAAGKTGGVTSAAKKVNAKTGGMLENAAEGVADNTAAQPPVSDKGVAQTSVKSDAANAAKNVLTGGTHDESLGKQSIRAAALEVGAKTAKGFATGFVAGAVKDGAIGLAKNKRLRNIVLAVIAATLAIYLLIIGMFFLTASSVVLSLMGGQEDASLQTAKSSGVDEKILAEARLEATPSAPWQLIGSLKKQLNADDIDTPLLVAKINEANTKHIQLTLDAGSVFDSTGRTRIVPQDKPVTDAAGNNANLTDEQKAALSSQVAAALKVKEVYVNALTAYPGMDKSKAEKTYKRAMGWLLAQEAKCPAKETATVATDASGAWDADQMAIAKTIIGVAKTATKSRPLAEKIRAAEIAVSVGMVETHLTNIMVEVDHDSLGVFQQRATWGSKEQRNNPTWAAARFLKAMFEKLPDWASQEAGVVAQKVQVSAYPDRYTQEMPEAKNVVASLWDQSPEIPIPADLVLPGVTGGAAASDDPLTCLVPVGTGAWRYPFDLPVTINDWYGAGRASGTGHSGIDVGRLSGKPIYAITDGTVTFSTGSSMNTLIGYWVAIRHGEYVVRYLHLQSPPLVSAGDKVVAGQQIGVSGCTGTTCGGPHLHFDFTPVGQPVDSMHTIDPVPILLANGVDMTVLPLMVGVPPYQSGLTR